MDYTKLKGCYPGGDPVGLKGPDGMNTLSSYQAGKDDMITIIKAEIERQKTINKSLLEGQLKDGCLYAFNQVLKFLSTLEPEKPVPADLEEAAEEYLQRVKAGFLRTLEHPTAKDCFIHGAKWDREQMLKDAVKWLVDDDYNPQTDKGRFILGSAGLGYNGYYIPYSDLLKLPKEDEQ